MKAYFEFVSEKSGLTTIIIEPWAEEYRIIPHAKYSFEFDTYSLPSFAINVVEPYLIVTAPPNSVCELRENGVCLSRGQMTNRSP